MDNKKNVNTIDNSNKRKISPIKLTIILIDIIVIILIVFSYINKNLKIKTNITDYTYKNFTYVIPKDMNFSSDDYSIYLNKEKWDAKIEILVDNNSYIRKYPDFMKKLLSDVGYKNEGSNTIKISNKDVIVYEATVSKNNVIIAYLYVDNGYVYEIELSNDSNSHNYNYLDTIVNILINAKYTAEKEYNYHVFDISSYLNENNDN